MSGNITTLIGDCRDLLPTLPSESVHTVVTSPPYWGLRDYGAEGQIGLEPTPLEFVMTMRRVFGEVYRVLRSDGTLWLNLGDTYSTDGKWGGNKTHSGKNTRSTAGGYRTLRLDSGLPNKNLIGIPWRVAFALQDAGWILRSEIIWAKPNPMPESVTDRPTKSHEHIFLFTKQPNYYYDADAIREPASVEKQTTPEEYAAIKAKGSWKSGGLTMHAGSLKGAPCVAHPAGRNKRDVWAVPSQAYPDAHFATFPEKLIEPCILAGTSDHGCCPACGAPYRRLTEPTEEYKKHLGTWNGTEDVTRYTEGAKKKGVSLPGREVVQLGWQAGCQCNAGPAVPCTVLDPFGGSGTTAQVAVRNRRNAILIEINPGYGKQIQTRTDGTQYRLAM